MDIQIMECRRFSAAYDPVPMVRTIKDYEIDLELGNSRMVVIDGEERIIKRGDVSVRKPGQTIYGKGRAVQTSILLTVDFSGRQTPQTYSRNMDGPLQPICQWELLKNLNDIITPSLEYTFIPIYTELLHVAFTDPSAAGILITELLHRLNAEVCRQAYAQCKPRETPCSRALEFMSENLDQDISLQQLAQRVHLEKNYFVRLFRNTYGQTPIQALIAMRMDRASDLVTNTQMNIANIAAACGYSSASHFIAAYKKHYGRTPLQQRKDTR